MGLPGQDRGVRVGGSQRLCLPGIIRLGTDQTSCAQKEREGGREGSSQSSVEASKRQDSPRLTQFIRLLLNQRAVPDLFLTHTFRADSLR